jgi:hypothetical protein
MEWIFEYYLEEAVLQKANTKCTLICLSWLGTCDPGTTSALQICETQRWSCACTCLINRHILENYASFFLISVFNGGEWSTSRPDHFTPSPGRENPRYLTDTRPDVGPDPFWTLWRIELSFSMLGIDSRLLGRLGHSPLLYWLSCLWTSQICKVGIL